MLLLISVLLSVVFNMILALGVGTLIFVFEFLCFFPFHFLSELCQLILFSCVVLNTLCTLHFLERFSLEPAYCQYSLWGSREQSELCLCFLGYRLLLCIRLFLYSSVLPDFMRNCITGAFQVVASVVTGTDIYCKKHMWTMKARCFKQMKSENSCRSVSLGTPLRCGVQEAAMAQSSTL